jgi:hypothetical protein
MTANGDDDDQLRWGLGVFLGGCVALLPLLIGRSDVPTTVVVSAIAAVVILPVWRHVGGPLSSPLAVIAFLEFVIGMLVIGRVFGGGSIATWMGAWFCALGSIRFLTGWRDTP